MSMISKDIFLRLMNTCDVKTLKELSNKYGYKDNWATTTRKREGIPLDICAKVSKEKGVTMDYLLFGSQAESSDINKLRQSITDGIFRAIKTDMVTLDENARISDITEIIMTELRYVYKYNADEAALMSEEIVKSLKID